VSIIGPARIVFAASFVLLGAFSIFFPGFALVWPSVPKLIAWHGTLAVLAGAALLAGGIFLLVPRTARLASLFLAVVLLLRILMLQAPHVVAHPLVEGTWEELGENLIFVAGAWTMFSMWPRQRTTLANFGSVRAGQILFALALPAIGLSHFFYLGETAPLIPPWLPLHVPLSYLTGAAHFAAGLGILFGVLPRLAATLEAIMVSLFTFIVWVPMVIAAPTSPGNWSEICVSAAISAAAWAIANSLRGNPWRPGGNG